LYLKDTNGDGRADVRQTVFSGFGTSNVQGLFNSFRWGLDNRIHGAGSSTGGNVKLVSVKASGGHQPLDKAAAPVSISGRDFAFDPRTHELEATSGGCQHGMCFDEWGRKFVCSNSSHIELVMFEDRYLRRNRYLAAPAARQMIAADGGQAEVFRISPVEPWRLVRTRLRVAGQVPGPVEGGGRAAGYFTSATGITIYTGNAWPEEYRGMAFVGDVGSNIVHRKRLQPDGVGLKGMRIDEKKEFLASNDIWFRPVQFANAPDGTLYVIDMYREVIEHPLSLPPVIKKHLDLTSGRDRGRIYRIVPEGFKQPGPPRLDQASTAELVATLEHPNGWHRETAARLLYERQDKSAIAPLRLLAKRSRSPLGRMHALHALAGLEPLDADLLTAALADKDARVREHAVQLAEKKASELGVSRLSNVLLSAAETESDARVRYQLAFSLGEMNDGGRVNALVKIARRDGGDAWVRLAVLSSLSQGAGAVFETLAADKEHRRTSAGRQMLEALARQIGLAKRTDEVADVLKSVAELSKEDASKEDAAAASALVRELAQGLNKSGSELRGVLASAGGDTARTFDELLKTARQTAADAKQSPSARAEATRTLGLGTFSAERELLTKLLDNRQPREVQEASLVALGRFTDKEVSQVVLRAWNGFSPPLRAQATELLLARVERIEALLETIEAGRFRPTDLEPARIEFLRKHQSDRIRERAGKLLAEVKLRRRQDVIDAYQGALKLTGDPARGKKHFEKTCAKCHRVEGIGYELAPNLAAMKTRGADSILVNVLDPNREVNPQYVNYLALTEDGRTLTGLVAAETATSITLRRGDNQSDTLLRVDISAMQSTGLSIMPEGLEKELDQQALADLIAFLMAAK
jgi:putative membrane-bound dehydrogenase-like protein